MIDPILIVLVVVVAAVVLFVTEWVSADVVAILVLVSLAVTGVLTPQEALAGFSSTATLTVLAMFILSAGVFQTGIINVLTNRLQALGAGSEARFIVVIALIVGPISAFVNNTAAVAILIPLVVALALQGKRAPSRFLIPLSYASQMGGVLTLIGTSTNLLASEVAARSGHRPLGIFEFTATGLAIFGVGLVYLVLVAPRLLPERGRPEEGFEPRFRAEVLVKEGSTVVGLDAASDAAAARLGGDVHGVIRDGRRLPVAGTTLAPGDFAIVEGAPKKLLEAEAGGTFRPLGRTRAPEGLGVEEGYEVVEMVVSPGSPFMGREANLSRFEAMDAYVVGTHRRERLAPAWLRAGVEEGDTLLVIVRADRVEALREQRGILLAREVPRIEFRRHRVPHVLLIFVGVVGFAAMGVAPIAITALAGAVAMVVTGVLTVEEMYRSVRWDVVFLLAGLIPLGTALVKTGGAAAIASALTGATGGWPPWALIFAVYVISGLLTEVMSNNGTVVLMVPVMVTVAQQLGHDPTPFVLAVAYAASTSFMTPIGYQTNTMVYGPGDYRFSDFFRVGAPLNLILAVVTTAALSFLYGFA